MVWSSLAPKWPIPVPFSGMDHQKSNFSLICDTLVRPAWVTFLKTGWWNSNAPHSGYQNHLQTNSSLQFSICQTQFKKDVSIWDTLYMRRGAGIIVEK
jgi:hypothetical protein